MANERIYYILNWPLVPTPLLHAFGYHVCIYVKVCICKAMCVEVREHLQDLGLSFYYVGPKDEKQCVKLGGKHL